MQNQRIINVSLRCCFNLNHWGVIALALLFLAPLTGCGRGASSSKQEKPKLTAAQKKRKAQLAAQTLPDTDSSVTAPQDTAPMRPDPITLGTLKESAYGKTLHVDGTTVYLLTPTAMWRFSPDHPPSETKLDLKFSPAFTKSEVIFWSKGKMLSIPQTGGPVKSAGPVKHHPRKIVASGDHFGWLDLSEGGSYTIQTLKNGQPRILYRTTNKVTSPIMLADRIYFVERATGEDTTNREIHWRIGGVSINPDVPHIFGRWEVGRTPSMLGGRTNVTYFDMPTRSVRRLSADLKQNVIIANKVVCTPFAVSDRVICSRVEGLFELPKGGGDPHILADKPMGLTVNIAASDQLVAWLSDTGENELTLRVLPLSRHQEKHPTNSASK